MPATKQNKKSPTGKSKSATATTPKKVAKYSDPDYIRNITEKLAKGTAKMPQNPPKGSEIIGSGIERSPVSDSKRSEDQQNPTTIITEMQTIDKQRKIQAFGEMMQITKQMSSQQKGCMGIFGRWGRYIRYMRLLMIIPVAGLSLYSMLSIWQIFKEYPDAQQFSNLINPLNTLDFASFDPFDPDDTDPSEKSTTLDKVDRTIKDLPVNEWKKIINSDTSTDPDKQSEYTSPYDDPKITDFKIVLNGVTKEYTKKSCFEEKVRTVIPKDLVERSNTDKSCTFSSKDGSSTILFVLHRSNYPTEISLLKENLVYTKADEIGRTDPTVEPLDITFGERTYNKEVKVIPLSQNSTFATIDMEGKTRMIGLVTDPSLITYDYVTFDFELSESDSSFEANIEEIMNVLMEYSLISVR